MILGGCKPNEKTTPEAPSGDAFEVLEAGRQDFEIARDKKLLSENFFDAHEMATIAVLADIILPKDDVSGSATEAGVPDFIEFIVKDMPRHQLPLRGGLRWLDLECYQRFEKAFVDCSPEQRLQVVDDIAYPKKVKPGLEQGAAFFDRMRDLTATGFYTSEIGIQDLGYAGNMANKWQGPPDEELVKFGFK
jgi:hypothetical protein